MVDEEHIGVNAILGSKKKRKEPEGGAAAATKEPKVGGGLGREWKGV
jgi:hypothetical protein